MQEWYVHFWIYKKKLLGRVNFQNTRQLFSGKWTVGVLFISMKKSDWPGRSRTLACWNLQQIKSEVLPLFSSNFLPLIPPQYVSGGVPARRVTCPCSPEMLQGPLSYSRILWFFLRAGETERSSQHLRRERNTWRFVFRPCLPPTKFLLHFGLLFCFRLRMSIFL